MKVTGFDNVERFREFSLVKSENEHSVCVFSFVADSFDSYEDKLDITVKMIEDDRCLMIGKVVKLEYMQGGTENIVTVTVKSQSHAWDLAQKTRVFQKQGQNYTDIVNAVAKINGIQVDISQEVYERELSGPIVQNHETDFSFLRRIAGEGFGTSFFIKSCDGSKESYIIGNDISDIKELSKDKIISLTVASDLQEKRVEFAIGGSLESQELRQYVDVGKKIKWNNREYSIVKFTVRKINGVFRFLCMGVSRQIQRETEKSLAESYLLHARVCQNEDPQNYGRLSLDFSDSGVEDMTAEDKMWFDLLTPYTANSGGIVFLPETDDRVEVIWDGSSFYVIGSRRETELAERYRDVKLKQIGNLCGKNICFSEENLELSAEDSKITIMEDEISIETKGSKIVINDDMAVSSGKIHIDADEMEYNIKKKYLCESENIGLNASSKVKIEGKEKVAIN